MNTKPADYCPLMLLLLVAFSTAAVATDVYRWTDSNGLVHYGQRPPDAAARKIDIDDRVQQDPRELSTDAQRRARQQRLLESYEYEREQKRARAEEAAARSEQLARRCSSLQRRWRLLSHAGPVYFQRDDGRRDYLSEEQRNAEKREMQAAYRQACGHVPE
jgi:hypothetical protein